MAKRLVSLEEFWFFDHYLEPDLLATDCSTYLKPGKRILAQELVDPVDRALN